MEKNSKSKFASIMSTTAALLVLLSAMLHPLVSAFIAVSLLIIFIVYSI